MIKSHRGGHGASICVTADSLACVRGTRTIFETLSFVLQGGDGLAVRGENGAGKTSLLRILAGLLSYRGRLDYVGIDRRSCHFMGHDDGFKSALTLNENLRFAAALLGVVASDLASLCQQLGLAQCGDLPLAVLSAGQRRRAMLGRLLLAPRPLWLLDEPYTALDETGRALIDKLMASHLVEGGIVVAATHESLGFATQQIDLSARGMVS